jgi:hypothetical protein
MTAPEAIAIRGMASVENVDAGGRFTAYLPLEPVPPPIKPGDRLRVRLEVDDETWIYAIAELRQEDYWKVGAWAPGEHAAAGVRMLWPGGRVLGADDARMRTLIVIASRAELPWARDLVPTSCADLVDKMPAQPPVALCDHLHGLAWKVPPRIRGMVPPVVDFFHDGTARLPGVVVEHRDAPFVAVEWQFIPGT